MITNRQPFTGSSPRRQRGIVLVMVVLALAVLMAMAGLALDGAYSMLNKTRLQNMVDAAALSAAKTLDQRGGDVVLAEADARAIFADNALDAGNAEIANSQSAGEVNIALQFSNTLIPFAPGTTPAHYVRVTATNLRLDTALLTVMGRNEMVIEASAVAGPSTSLGRTCNIAPMMICTATPEPVLDPLAAGYDPYFGYTPDEVVVLKAGQEGEAMQKGNFQLIRLEDATGAADLRAAMAGSYNACINPDEDIETEPGNTVGPVAQGLNTRLNIYDGPMRGTEAVYPPDTNVTQSSGRLKYVEEPKNSGNWIIQYQDQGAATTVVNGDEIPYSYAEYNDDRDKSGLTNGVPGRREFAVPMGVCGGEAGQSTVEYATTLCFYLLQDVDQGPNPDVFGQFTPTGCQVEGTAGPAPVSGPGPYVIQLYKDSARTES